MRLIVQAPHATISSEEHQMMTVDPRFTQTTGRAIFNGGELLVKGALEVEGGVHLFVGYPATPFGPFFETLKQLRPLRESHGQVLELTANEALGFAAASGSQKVGCRVMVAVSSQGLLRGSETLMQVVLQGTPSGAGTLIAIGDYDMPADSRFFAQHIHLPMIEPANPQQIKDWVNLAYMLGQAGRTYIGYLLTGATIDGGGAVDCWPNHFPKRPVASTHTTDRLFMKDSDLEKQRTIEERFKAIKVAARQLGINQIHYRPQRGEKLPLGFVASGQAYTSLMQALRQLNLIGRIPVLQLGMSYPVDEVIVSEFAQQCDRLVVVETGRSFVEDQLLQLLQPKRQAGQLQVEIFGKQFPDGLRGISSEQTFNPSMLIERLIPLLKKYLVRPAELTDDYLERQLEQIRQSQNFDWPLPKRTETFCVGCPQRDATSVIEKLQHDLRDSQYMLERHKCKPVNLSYYGDAGCNSLLGLPHVGTGANAGAATGTHAFSENRAVVFMGDSTFFHSGQVAITQAIRSKQDVTFVILDNKLTPPISDPQGLDTKIDLAKELATAKDIHAIIQGMVMKPYRKNVKIVTINPTDAKRYRNLLEEMVLEQGVKIIIVDKTCGINVQRQKQMRETMKSTKKRSETWIHIATEVCDACHECTLQTHCPGLTLVATDRGLKVQIDLSTCTDDGACYRISACPAFERMTVVRTSEPSWLGDQLDLTNLPDPPEPVHGRQDVWRCFLAGIGGMGVGVAASILSHAGHAMGYDVKFLEHKSLAVRTGSAFASVVFAQLDSQRANDSLTAVLPYGKADLLLGFDLLEASRAMSKKAPYRVVNFEKTTCLINTHQVPTAEQLSGQQNYLPQKIVNMLKREINTQKLIDVDITHIAQTWMGSTRYLNMMFLGMAYQQGLLPLTLDIIEQAIWAVVGSDVKSNLHAFALGRKLAATPELLGSQKPLARTPMQLFRYCAKRLRESPTSSQRVSEMYRQLIHTFYRQAGRISPRDPLMRQVIVSTFDCINYRSMDYAKRYVKQVLAIYQKDSTEYGLRLTRAVARSLANCMVIKDQIYIASQLTDPEKYKQDCKLFNINQAAGDQLVYHHFTHLSFDLFGRQFNLDWKMRDWQLKMITRLKPIRKMIPKWMKRERAFCHWYEKLLTRMDWASQDDQRAQQDYQRWFTILSAPQSVTGFGDVRYLKMTAARRQVEQWLAADPETFNLPIVSNAVSPAFVHDQQAIALPILNQ